MFSSRRELRVVRAVLASGIALLGLASNAGFAADPYPGIGRAATPKELQAWDIDVRPDFKGLPKGSGSVAQGQVVWEAKCASCHGIFGESGEVFNPIVGGTTKDDVRTGHAARLTDSGYPGRTTLMKLATVSTLWDYVHRAMPWNQPKSLAVDEVYAVTAYMLNLGGVLPDDFVLSERTIGQAQMRLPNRNGMSTEHALWPGPEFGRRAPDAKARLCMRDCSSEPTVVSFVPDYARDAHGNLVDQNRLVGPQRGAQTMAASAASVPAPTALLDQNACSACHGVDSKLVGPSFRDISTKYVSRDDALGYLVRKIRAGGSGVWGAVSMPPQPIAESDAREIARWIVDTSKR